MPGGHVLGTDIRHTSGAVPGVHSRDIPCVHLLEHLLFERHIRWLVILAVLSVLIISLMQDIYYLTMPSKL